MSEFNSEKAAYKWGYNQGYTDQKQREGRPVAARDQDRNGIPDRIDDMARSSDLGDQYAYQEALDGYRHGQYHAERGHRRNAQACWEDYSADRYGRRSEAETSIVLASAEAEGVPSSGLPAEVDVKPASAEQTRSV